MKTEAADARDTIPFRISSEGGVSRKEAAIRKILKLELVTVFSLNFRIAKSSTTVSLIDNHENEYYVRWFVIENLNYQKPQYSVTMSFRKI